MNHSDNALTERGMSATSTTTTPPTWDENAEFIAYAREDIRS